MTYIRERVEKLLGYRVDPAVKPTFAGRALSDNQARSIAFEIAEDFKTFLADPELRAEVERIFEKVEHVNS